MPPATSTTPQATTSTTTAPQSSSTTTSEASTTTTAPALPVVPACAGSSSAPAVRPPTILVTCTGAAVGISGISWRSWGTISAYGFGTASVDDCQPDCAAGTQQQYPASVYVFGATMTDPPVFQEITVTPTGSTGNVQSSYRPGTWGVP